MHVKCFLYHFHQSKARMIECCACCVLYMIQKTHTRQNLSDIFESADAEVYIEYHIENNSKSQSPAILWFWNEIVSRWNFNSYEIDKYVPLISFTFSCIFLSYSSFIFRIVWRIRNIIFQKCMIHDLLSSINIFRKNIFNFLYTIYNI